MKSCGVSSGVSPPVCCILMISAPSRVLDHCTPKPPSNLDFFFTRNFSTQRSPILAHRKAPPNDPCCCTRLLQAAVQDPTTAAGVIAERKSVPTTPYKNHARRRCRSQVKLQTSLLSRFSMYVRRAPQPRYLLLLLLPRFSKQSTLHVLFGALPLLFPIEYRRSYLFLAAVISYHSKLRVLCAPNPSLWRCICPGLYPIYYSVAWSCCVLEII